ncbi:hypothetical protein Cenrod_2203 [Candidatus Symbiobacter mobilis CR]|uniref:Uncharacterized protein n=1 Tax=Candidatus Symbiobacter mobilis CR TaxID=946483 RepID=U5N9M4_9BURK|nr:hypothetical protein Cenrod_2203 [Candidatus Symbiobacter mobilis CR]
MACAVVFGGETGVGLGASNRSPRSEYYEVSYMVLHGFLHGFSKLPCPQTGEGLGVRKTAMTCLIRGICAKSWPLILGARHNPAFCIDVGPV